MRGLQAPPETCGELAVAELSPAGRWTAPQPLARSVAATPLRLNPWKSVAGGSSSPGKKVAPGDTRTISVAVGRLGSRLSWPRRAQRLMRSEPEDERLETTTGPNHRARGIWRGSHVFSQHVIERAALRRRTARAPVFPARSVVSDQGDRLALPDGGETYVFWGATGAALRCAPRVLDLRARAPVLEDVELDPSGREPAGRVLIVLRQWAAPGSRLIAAEVLPRGASKRPRARNGASDRKADTTTRRDRPGGQELVIRYRRRSPRLAYAAASRCGVSAHAARDHRRAIPPLFVVHMGSSHLGGEDDATIRSRRPPLG